MHLTRAITDRGMKNEVQSDFQDGPPLKNEVKITLAPLSRVKYNAISLVIAHIFAAMGLYYIIRGQVKLQTLSASKIIFLSYLRNFGTWLAELKELKILK